MKTKRLRPLRIYDWNETVAKNKTRGIKFKGYVPEDFSKEINNKNISVRIDGLWKEWELTDEGTGQYPIFKCTVKDGSLEIKNKNTHEKYSLKNAWIKVCTKIHYDNSDGIDTYSINRKALTLYSINNSFNLEGKNSIVVELLNSLLISWIKDNVECLNKFFRQYKVKTETKEDLSLLGWDTGYSTSFTNVNKVIEQQKTYPENFEETANSSYVKIYISGEFYPWKISTGADGQNVNFNCSIKPGGAIEISGYEFQFSDGNFVNIQVALKYLNVDNPTFEDPTSLNVGNQVDLMVKTEKGENNTDSVTITSSNYTGSTGAEEKMFIDAAFKAWFNENIDAFKQIFSSFLLNETSKNEDFQWLKPTTAYYGVASVETTDGKPDLDSSVFSVMSMVENNENSKPSHTVDSRILDAANNESAFAIKTPLFVQKWLIIGLEMMQVGTIDDFELISNGYGFKNKNKIQFATFENADGNNVPAYVEKDNFRLEIVNNQLKIEINDIVWEQSRRLNGHVNYSQYFDLELKSGIDELGEKYENVLIPVENTDPVLVITITQDEFDIWGDVVGDIIGGIVVGVVTGYLGSIVGKGIGTYLGKQLSKTSSGSWILKIDKAISDYLKNLFKGDKNAFNKISKDNLGLIEVHGIKESSKLIANTATNYASKIWANKSKFIGALIAGSVGFAIPKLIINAIDNYDKQHYSVLPNINDFVASTVGAVKWPDNSEFKLESAELSGVFLLGGKLERD